MLLPNQRKLAVNFTLDYEATIDSDWLEKMFPPAIELASGYKIEQTDFELFKVSLTENIALAESFEKLWTMYQLIKD